jgi:glycosyltransferase involved in cell wall biosynthesis
MRIGFISTRLNGTDGVSLETGKWAQVFQRLGHDPYYAAGELGGYAQGGTLIPQLHFNHPSIAALTRRAFGEDQPGNDPRSSEQLTADINAAAAELHDPLYRFIQENRLNLIVIQNALAIPMNLPLGVCLGELIVEVGMPVIAHHHDFYWERSRYQATTIPELLDAYFPPDLPGIRHVTINSIAQQRLKARRGLDSCVVPNVFDFTSPAPGVDAYNRDFRQAIGLSDRHLFVLQPTRVIPRKGIELSIELLSRMHIPGARLVITHAAGDEGLAYWNWLQREARQMGVDLRLIDQLIGDVRQQTGGHKVYSLWDAYPHADLVTYPSLYEGFGNALLETIYFRRLAVINRYPVYNADLGPLGFSFIELDGFVDDASLERLRQLLHEPEEVQRMVDHNFAIAQEHFSLQVLERKLKEILASF